MIKKLRLKCLLLAAALTITQGINAQNVKLVKDVNANTDANPSGYTLVNGASYFTADDGIHGTELWRTDGTAAGTALVKDITPGTTSSNISCLTAFKGKLLFVKINNNGPQQLWSSDGTDAGTHLVKTITPQLGMVIDKLAVVDSLVYFIAGDSYYSENLWKTNGTTVGTLMVANISTSALGNGFFASNLTSLNGLLFFSMNNSDGPLLLRSNGTAAGTAIVKAFSDISGSGIPQLSPVNGLLYFIAYDAGIYKLWATDGTTAGTKILVGDINNQLAYTPGYMPLTAIKHTLFFYTYNANGVKALGKYNTDIANSLAIVYNADYKNNNLILTSPVAVNDSLLFFLTANGPDKQQLWVTTSSAAACTPLKTNGNSAQEGYSNMTAVGPNLFFNKRVDSLGAEPWVSNGTDAGTHLIKDIFPGIYSSQARAFSYLTKGVVLFCAADGKNGFELWLTDGKYTTASMVTDINKTTTADNFVLFNPSSYITFNSNGLLFAGDDFSHGLELWKTDGTTVGTYMLKDVAPGNNSGFSIYSSNLQKLKNEYFYFSNAPASTFALWKTDGTPNGTVALDTFKGYEQFFFNNNITPAKSIVYLAMRTTSPANKTELWVTDGVSKARLINNNFTFSTDVAFVTKGDSAYFVNEDPNGPELWITDGTTAGTHLVKDIYPGANGSWPYNLTLFNGKLYFNAFDGSGNNYLWVSDGSAKGTQIIKKVTGTHFFQGLVKYTLSKNKFYFLGDEGTTGSELWVSDGTIAGTTLVKDIYPGTNSSNIDNMVDVNGTMFFIANDGIHGNGLWKTNGTDTGTVIVKTLTPGAAGLKTQFMANGNGLLYFVLNDTLWQSNGTTTGTHKVTDAGLNGLSHFWYLVPSGNRLYFCAYSYQYGYELYVMGANSTLPVTMLSFTGQWVKNDAQLNWVTANELNSSHFNIQRSLNGTAFTTIGQVKAQGTTSSTYRYNYTDANAASLPASSLYYRLQQVDLDGNATYSNLVRLPLASNNTITIAPNPAHKAAYIISSTTITGAAVTIADMAGHTVYSSIVNLQAGTQVPLNIAGIPAGVYNVTIQNGIAIKQQSKLVVQ